MDGILLVLTLFVLVGLWLGTEAVLSLILWTINMSFQIILITLLLIIIIFLVGLLIGKPKKR